MKLILGSINPAEIACLRELLEEAGIACFMRNEISAGLSPEIPISESTPELWIEDDERLNEALQIKREWRSAPKITGSDWVCLKCGETSEPQFNSCWNCGEFKP
jgi:hypothetical protein